MGMDCTRAVKGLSSKDCGPLRKEDFCPRTVFELELQHQLFPGPLHISDLLSSVITRADSLNFSLSLSQPLSLCVSHIILILFL